MTRWLMALSVGPVQDFIAAARRTRDLWFGSFLLSEVSKAAALALYEFEKTISGPQAAASCLIFPAPRDPETELAEESELNVANIILAVCAADPKDAASAAKEGAVRRWEAFAEEAKRAAAGYVRDELWRREIEDVVEFYAAWVPFPEGTGYPDVRKRVMGLLSARKNCRDFAPWKGEAGVLKSSLDGLRESVLRDTASKKTFDRLHARLRLRKGELLCAVGVVKRLGGGKKPFPSVSRVAADPWIRGLFASRGEGLEKHRKELVEHCEKLAEDGVLVRVAPPKVPDSGSKVGESLREKTEETQEASSYEPFPFEGASVFPTRLDELLEEEGLIPEPGQSRKTTDLSATWPQVAGEEKGDQARLLFRVDALRAVLRRLQRPECLGEPFPYLAVLVADGDRMGKTISCLGSPEENRNFSRSLSAFAGEAQRIVAAHQGVCVYAGGDDVLAFLPLDTALACARKLHASFGDALKTWGSEGSAPTLSVGLAVGHFLEDLEDLLAFGREAEKLAKGNDLPQDQAKDGLAVVVRSRGGDAQQIRGRWSEKGPLKPLDERLDFWTKVYAQGALPAKFAYEVRGIAAFYKGWQDTVHLSDAARNDLRRLFFRKDVDLSFSVEEAEKDGTSGGGGTAEALKKVMESRIAVVKDGRDIERLADELIIAQWFAEAVAQAEGKTLQGKDAHGEGRVLG